MSNADYTIRLGNGLYMDSTGRFIPGPLDGVPTLPAPGGGLPISPEQAKKALEGISKSLSFEDPGTRKALAGLGVPDEFIDLLKDVAAVAGKLAKVVPYVGAVLAIGEMLGFLKSGPDPIVARMEALFKELRTLIVAKDEKWIDIEVGNRRETVVQGLNAAEEYIEEITFFTSDPAELKARLQLMRDMHQGVVTALNQLMNPAIWQSNIGEEYFKLTWPFNLHYEKSGSAPGPQDRVVRPTVGMDRFDHRVMVPVVCALTQSYLTFIKTIVPEYRSSGEYSEFLADLAIKIETLAEFMRSQTLARTHFTPYDFTYLYPKSPNSPFSPPWYGGYHVGAVDLCARNVPVPPIPYNFMWIVDGTGAKVDYGAVHYNWTPPAQLQKEDWGQGGVRYLVLNPDECAAAANAQAEQDYGSILYSSGYMNLVQLAGLLRHVYTAPSTSETVTGSVLTHHSQGSGSTVTVTSQSVFPFSPATATAQRYGQTNRGRVSATTQPRGRLREFNYRIVLRTLPAGMDGISDYGEVYSTRYQNESLPKVAGTAPFSELICDLSGGVVGEKVLATGKTPAQPVTAEGTATLAADTFDWWVPVPDTAQAPGGPVAYLSEMRALGWASRFEHIQPAQSSGTGSGAGAPVPSSPTLVEGVYDSVVGLFESDLIRGPTPQPVGQRREVERKTIEVTYALEWDGIDLKVTLETEPQYRNVDLYLVVEETIAKGQVMHTAFVVPMTGQITYVPEKFFKDEAEVIEAANGFWRDLIDKYAEQVEVSPLDPIARISQRELSSIDGLERVAELVRTEQPEFLQTFMRERPMTQASADSPRFVLTRSEPGRVGATRGRRRK